MADPGAPHKEIGRDVAEEINRLTGVPVSLRMYIEAILDEQRRGVVVAEQEREKAAQALSDHLEQRIDSGDAHITTTLIASIDESRRGLAIAEQEREKAAQALRQELARSIADGDTNLREHIHQQIHQIREALTSSEKLELERFERTKDMIRSVEEKLQIIQKASEDAVAKAETANEKRFESVNEWRGQSLDRENSQREETARLTSTFMPREVADAQMAELRKQISSNTDRLNTMQGSAQAERRGQDRVQPVQLAIASGVISLIVALIVIGVGAFT